MRIAPTQSLHRLLLSHELAFLVLVAVTGMMGGAWAYFWQQTSAESIRLNHLAHAAQDIRTALFRQIKEVALARLRDDPTAEAVYADYYRQIQAGFNALRQHSGSRAEDYAIQRMQEAYSRLQSDMRDIFQDPFLLNRIVRIKILDPSYEQAVVHDFEEAFKDFRGLVERALTEQEDAMKAWTDKAPLIVPIPFVIALALLWWSRVSLSRGFVRPMRAIMSGTRRMSAGDLATRLPDAGVEEVAALARGINHMASELAASRDALIESERQAALGALVPVVAHNIRNPLASIRANAQLLDPAEDREETQDIAAALIATVDRLDRWVSALVSYLHPLQPRLRPMDASVLLAAVEDLMRQRLAERELRIRREPWSAGLRVAVDPDLMEQALYGLLSNAVDASHAGGEIRLGVSAAGARVRMEIEDRGGGMPFIPAPSELAPGPSTKRFGTGLGIPVAFKVCKAHGWTLDFESVDDVGTRVVMGAPRLPDEATHDDAG